MAEAFRALVIEMIGRMGRYHKLLMVLFVYHNFIVAISHTSTSFHTYVPQFHCKGDITTKCNGSCPGGYEFEGNATTIATEFSLVCDRKMLAPLLNSLYFAGVTLGAFACGALADIYGRKLLVITCLYMQGLLYISFYFIHNLPLVMTVRAIQGFFVQGLQGVTYALMLEQCNPKLRTFAGAFWQCFWSFGMIYLALSSYFVPDWHELELVLAIPTFITLLWIWLIPESLTWLIIRNRLEDACALSVKLGKWNKDKKFLDDVKGMEPITDSPVGPADAPPAKISDMLKNPILRRHTYIMTTMWFAIATGYYGILYFLPNVAGERHLNFAVGALVEIVSSIIAYFIFRKWGRRIPMAVYQYLVGLTCFAITVISIVGGPDGQEPGHWSRTPIAALAILGKALAIACFCGMFIYAGECFPTGCRGAAMGLCGFFARCGSLVSPQIIFIGEFTFESCPLIIVGIFVTITGTSTLLLPETLGITLPNTIDDVNRLWGK